MRMRKKVVGKEQPDTLDNMAKLTSTNKNQGREKEMKNMGVRMMNTFLRKLGLEHPDTLDRMSEMASWYRRLRRWEEAGKMEEQVMSINLQTLGAEHPRTQKGMKNLALIYSAQGRLEEAKKLEEQDITSKEIIRVYEDHHPLNCRELTFKAFCQVQAIKSRNLFSSNTAFSG